MTALQLGLTLTPAVLPANIAKRLFITADGCWLFTGATQTNGYGSAAIGDRGRTGLVHRIAYEAAYGPIPDGLTVDHLCHGWDRECPGGKGCAHRRCCNPAHLEAVAIVENVRRSHNTTSGRTTCKQGHPFDDVDAHGHRRCSRCYREYLDSHRAEHRAKQRAKYAADNPVVRRRRKDGSKPTT